MVKLFSTIFHRRIVKVNIDVNTMSRSRTAEYSMAAGCSSTEEARKPIKYLTNPEIHNTAEET